MGEVTLTKSTRGASGRVLAFMPSTREALDSSLGCINRTLSRRLDPSTQEVEVKRLEVQGGLQLLGGLRGIPEVDKTLLSKTNQNPEPLPEVLEIPSNCRNSENSQSCSCLMTVGIGDKCGNSPQACQ